MHTNTTIYYAISEHNIQRIFFYVVPVDYTQINNRVLTFAPGEVEQCLDVDIAEDNIDELDEDLTLLLTTTQDNVIINRDSTTVLIEDVDGEY